METDTPAAAASEALEKASANPPLNFRNWANLVAYILNAFFIYAIGVFGTAGETNEYLSLKYQTLITPAGWAFSIWAVIFAAELCFVVAQMTARWRACQLVQDGVKERFIAACILQILWSASFSYEYITISFLIMIGLCYVLVEILKAQYVMDDSKDSRTEYWLLRFPFEIHCGWIVAATFVNLNVWLVSLDSPPWLLITIAALSLLGIVILAIMSVWRLLRPIFAVGAALTWAVIGIAEELNDPKQSIFNSFTTRTISAFAISAATLATILSIAVITRYVKKFLKDRKKERELAEAAEALDERGSAGEIASDFVKVEDDKEFVKVDAEQV